MGGDPGVGARGFEAIRPGAVGGLECDAAGGPDWAGGSEPAVFGALSHPDAQPCFAGSGSGGAGAARPLGGGARVSPVAGRDLPLSALLGLLCLGLLSGRKNLAEIHRLGQFLNQSQRGWLGFLPGRGTSRRLRAPGYKALYNLLGQLDPETVARSLTRWLSAHEGVLPRGLALDGKWVRESMQLIVEAGGDFLFQLKDNQPKALARAQATAASEPLLFAPRAASN